MYPAYPSCLPTVRAPRKALDPNALLPEAEEEEAVDEVRTV